MAPTDSECANCGIPASLRCTGCIDAPEYYEGDVIDITYCSRECQRSHWRIHKARCTHLRQRRRLLRAARILKAVLLTYRETFFDIPLSKIELRNSVLYLHRHPSQDVSPRPFPKNLTANVAHKEAALTHNQCTLALALLGPLTRKLLAGIALSIENLDLQIGKPLVPTRLVELVPGADLGGAPHTVLKVGIQRNETWIVDTAGCQYGFQDVLVPFHRYLADKGCAGVSRPTPYTHSETTDLDFLDTFFADQPHMNMGKIKGDRKGRLHFAAFVENRVGSGKEFFNLFKDLDGSAADFQSKLDNFMRKLKAHMETVYTA
ncbi:hypothetical protein B0H11DRAFT_1999147 [Mycena galericulata]|nr:hypothetical protein B0H11DRAFT_1999147 [Mycena galericulata]